MIANWFHQGASTIGPFFVLLGLLIFVHELGHFLVAKYFQVRVEVFSLGFGKKILKFQRGDTTYCISLIPLGGYVKMFGDDPANPVAENERAHSFLHKPVGQRIAIVLAGPLMNFFFAILLFGLVAIKGDPVSGTQVGDIDVTSKAYLSGFRSGDKIVSVEGKPVHQWTEVREVIEGNAGFKLHFQVEREGDAGKTELVVATPELMDNDTVLSTQRKVGKIQGLSLDSEAPLVGVISNESPFAKAGGQTLDLVTAVNGQKVSYFRELLPLIKSELNKSRKLEFQVRGYDIEKEMPLRTLAVEANQISAASPNLLAELGIESSDLYLLRIKKGSPAEQAGLKPGDRLLKVGDQQIRQWNQVIDTVSSYKNDKPLVFTMKRGDQQLEVPITPEKTQWMNGQGKEENRFAVGIVPAFISTQAPPYIFKVSNPLQAVQVGFNKTIEWSKLLVLSVVRVVQAQISTKAIGGVISIGKAASQSYEVGIVAFMKMMAIISINLFILNLLPVPVLDGGHLLFFSIEALRGAPISLKKLEIAHQVGLILLLSLMVFALFNDISNIISSPW